MHEKLKCEGEEKGNVLMKTEEEIKSDLLW